MSKDLEFHEAANIFPMLRGTDFAELVEDIKQNGQLMPIDLYNGRILDGRSRYRACQQLDIKVEYRDVTHDIDDPSVHVMTANLHRRHLTRSQRAMIAAQTVSQSVGRGTRVTYEKAAGDYDLSSHAVADAFAVTKKCTAKLQDAVKRGAIKVSTAAKAAMLSPSTQDAIAGAKDPGYAARYAIRVATRQKQLVAKRDNAKKTKNEAAATRSFVECHTNRVGRTSIDPDALAQLYDLVKGVLSAIDLSHPVASLKTVKTRATRLVKTLEALIQ